MWAELKAYMPAHSQSVMSAPKKQFAEEPIPTETRREVERETALTEDARRPPTMIPGVANPHAVSDGADFYRRLYRPHGKRWVTVGVWVFFVLLPGLTALLILYALIRRFFGG
jgi:hypothetical protein